MNHWKLENGLPYPLGATWMDEGEGYNFALYSKAAKKVNLYFFHTESPGIEVYSYSFNTIINKTGAIWHCFVKKSLIANANCYAYRIDGNNLAGNCFNPCKLLLDPWSKSVFFPPDFSRSAAIDGDDNVGKAPLAILPKIDSVKDFFKGEAQPYHYHDLIIYEMHVRGFTQSDSSGVSEFAKGTYSGVVEKIPYLKELGITAVELMPVYQFDPQEKNYWGYSTLNFFAPHNLYSTAEDHDPQGIVEEFKRMVLAFHRAGIEVILDVVYNHTTEGDYFGPTYSFRGIDNSSYYLLRDMRHYVDDAGTGNVLRTSHNIVRKLILDSLRYWAEEMKIDGFRFDLATIFTRNDNGSINLHNPTILEEISMLNELSKVRLIAEPWDLRSYQLGQSFPGTNWGQWNGSFRDVIRGFVRGEENLVGQAICRVNGSPDFFPEELPLTKHPYQSINFITCHDGFTLYDLVSYNEKHNAANGEDNRDGATINHSWNCGWEGDDGVPAEVVAMRKQQAKNFITILMFSNGTPMFRMGDEFLHTQGGNNNPYNQDNQTSWLDWDRKKSFGDVFNFFKKVIHCRKSHPSIGRGRYWGDDVKWFGTKGAVDFSPHSRSFAYFLDGRAEGDVDFYVMINCYWEGLSFVIQTGKAGQWRRIIDTSLIDPDDILDVEGALPVSTGHYDVKSRSVVVLIRG